MKTIIRKGDDFLSIEETVGSMVVSMGLVSTDSYNDSDSSDKATCDFTIEIKRKYKSKERAIMPEEKHFESLDIINEILQACSYTDAMMNVMFKIPLPLVIKAEKLLEEEHYFQRKYGKQEQQ